MEGEFFDNEELTQKADNVRYYENVITVVKEYENIIMFQKKYVLDVAYRQGIIYQKFHNKISRISSSLQKWFSRQE